MFTPRVQLVAACVAGAMLLTAFLLRWLQPSLAPVGTGLDYASLAIGLVYGVRAAIEAGRTNWVDIDVLMVVAAVLAAAIGAPAEGALLLFLFTLAGALEDLALARTRRAVAALHKLLPTQAVVLREGAWVPVAPEGLVIGERIRVLPGEQVPTDARVAQGESSIDQASITGESQPRDVRPGDELYAGTINVGNPLEALVTRPASESSLQKVLALVTQAQSQRQPVQQLIDKVSQPYAIGVFVAAALVFALWWLALGREAKDAAYTAIGLLIVMSPCALVISTPTATLAAISRAARGGVLFKGGHAIERLARMRAIAFDKTGTLTVGRPSVRRLLPIGASSERELLAVGAALEAQSTHPIAEAIVRQAREQGVTPATVSDLRSVTGRGVSGTVDGSEARLGSLAHTREHIDVCYRNHVREVLEGVQHAGQIAVVCAHAHHVGVFILSDAARPGADCLVQRLHALGVRPVVMLTGDNRLTAERIATQLGLDEFHADLLPQDKVERVRALKAGLLAGKAGGGAGVIGDGVNDAPALALADVAIGIGSIGSDAALENADIVLLNDDLSAVPWAVGLARRARRTITINLAFAIGAMALMALGVVVGSLWGWRMPLWMGVVGHEGGTLLVVAHSLLLLGHRGIPVCTCPRDGEEHGHAPGAPVALTVGASGAGA